MVIFICFGAGEIAVFVQKSLCIFSPVFGYGI